MTSDAGDVRSAADVSCQPPTGWQLLTIGLQARACTRMSIALKCRSAGRGLVSLQDQKIMFSFIVILTFSLGFVEGQFPRVCTTEASFRTKSCCPLWKDKSPCGSLSGRGRCKDWIASSGEKIPQYNDDRLDWPRHYYDYTCECFGNYSGFDCGDCKFGFHGEKCDRKKIVLRREIRELTVLEQKRLFSYLALAKTTKSQDFVVLSTGDRYHRETYRFVDASLYDVFVWMHYYSMKPIMINSTFIPDKNFAHQGPVFPGWHRLNLLFLERQIQLMTRDDDFAIPYYDWRSDKGCSICTDELMGTNDEQGELNPYSHFSFWKTCEQRSQRRREFILNVLGQGCCKPASIAGENGGPAETIGPDAVTAEKRQQETNRLLMQQIQQSQQEQRQQMQQSQQQMQQSQQEQRQQMQQSQQEHQQQMQLLATAIQGKASAPTPGLADDTHVRKTVRRALQKMTPGDDVEAFLTVFERVAEREKLPPEQWAEVLAPYLTGEPQKAYYDLTLQDAKEYHKLKAEILARLGVTLTVRAQRVHSWGYHRDKPPRSQMFDLLHLVQKWLQPESSAPAQMVERVMMDRFVHSLPRPIQSWVAQGDPQNADELIGLVERYQGLEGSFGRQPMPYWGSQKAAESQKGVVPFERIAMDLVGPLVKSARGHQYILVILDYATRYPEAIPLRNSSSKSIARELVHVFSRTGLPKEILTDQGTPFMSKVMRELCKALKISQLRTSVYHPQSDGLVERFNKTLMSMLRKAIEKDGRDWDCLLPYLMFSIREVPQASTGFSPFELLYGRHPRGLLDIAKETWEVEVTPHRSVIEHVALMQQRIAKVMPIVKEHLLQAQEAQARVYNRSARVRQFNPGDRVLVLVPTVESKFLAKWQGPYEVVEKLGEVNYKIHQPGRRKPFQVYHVNLIKPWQDREPTVTPSLLSNPEDEVGAVTIAETLSESQKQQCRELLQKNRDLFSELPGYTKVIEHEVLTEPHVRVNVKPYRIPEARREIVSKEVERMLKLGVIEESKSGWSSPIVLVPKPDGEWRFCNDYRKLNEVSKFDAYPMPRVDELIERLGPARYITTLDLTKGYWQIPMAQEAKEKTAFFYTRWMLPVCPDAIWPTGSSGHLPKGYG
ncbi:unnamed protein product [Ranitomeya imitator]|uniref:ribonuclease H n=1 Tax=Ranitomeya imitator TaxID=111125 RepID=A0ABN9M9Z5_9NEOB|nr:unnamed protein product [Ranitomeya imitator]